MSGEFLLEVRAEEIPARMLEPAVRELSTTLFERLMARRLAPDTIETGFTPRRLVVALKGLPAAEPDGVETAVGPPVKAAFDPEGKPTKAAIGFAKRCGVPVEELQTTETERGEYVSVSKQVSGRPAADVLAEIVPEVLRGIAWPKTMRWGAGTGPWVRPIHGIVALLDGQPVEFSLFGISSGCETIGHPVLSPKPFEVKGIKDYRTKLSRRGLVVDFEKRRGDLKRALEEAAAQVGGELVRDAELLHKLTAICEVPGVVSGRIDESFLELPREVLIASLRDHQSAFTVESDGALLAAFLTVMDRPDDPDGRVQAGNEWVVAARLSDAQFFFHEDRKRPLADRAADLEKVTFHERLGSYAEKSERIGKLAGVIAAELGWEESADSAVRAAQLMKADLTTEVVGEFSDLQGVMGGVYARLDGEPEGVWRAVYDQYRPAHAADELPTSREGRIVGIADRIDTLVGIFGIGLVPSGSKDPFGLRRAAQGLVRIVMEGGLALDIDLIAARAARLYGEGVVGSGEEILNLLRPFLADRVRHLLGRSGYAYDEIEAGIAAGSSDLPDLARRVDALHTARDNPRFLDVVLSAKRIANIVKEEPEYNLDADRLREDAERALYEASRRLKAEIDEAALAGEYGTALDRVAEFSGVLERFFVEVLVMDEDREVRENRIGLLQSIGRTLSRCARLTEIVVDKSENRPDGVG